MVNLNNDLFEANRLWEQAIGLTEPEAPYFIGYLNNWAAGTYKLFERTKDISYLTLAIEALQLVIQLTPTNSPELPHALLNLGVSANERYDRVGNPSDLLLAKRAHERACQEGLNLNPVIALKSSLVLQRDFHYYETFDFFDLVPCF
jgi:hypothetical protein